MSENFVSVVVYVPVTHADAVREALAQAGAGRLGHYDSCSFSVRGTGRFRPLPGANPQTGEIGQIAAVEEERIETLCAETLVAEVLAAVRKVHPYEEPAMHVVPVRL